MSRFFGSWKRLSLLQKLYFVVGTMAVLIVCELVILKFSMQQVSAVRAFVSAEALWSKAQKDALLELNRFQRTKDEKHYQEFLLRLEIPAGDHLSRLELMKPEPDLSVIRAGFIKGRIHPDDIDRMVFLLRHFNRISYVAQAINDWGRGDELLQQIRDTAGRLHTALLSDHDVTSVSELEHINKLNSELTPIEDHFSFILGEGSRWLESTVLTIFFLMVLTVEATGLTLTMFTGREIAGVATENAKLYASANESVKMRDEFLSVASHELKTPLTSLALQLEMINKLTSKPNTPEISSQIHSLSERSLASTKRLSALLGELLDLTRIRVGKLIVDRQVCDLTSIVQDSVTQLAAEAAKKGSNISIKAVGRVMGTFDSTRMSQVIVNLVSNAIKYGNGQPINVSVEMRGSKAVVAVQDHGIGIPADKLSTLFQKFERVEQDPSIPGLGLGLFISNEIVKAHGGMLRAESQPGEGATFTMEIENNGG